MIEIPVNSDLAQRFSVAIDGVRYRVRVTYNSFREVWTMDLEDSSGPVVSGISLVGGVDLVKQYNLPFQGMYVINLEDSSADASATNLGEEVRVVILEEGDL